MKLIKNKSFIISVLISFAFCILLLYLVGVRQILLSFRNANYFYMTLAVLLLVPGFFIRALRWKIIYDNDQNNIKFLNSLFIYLAGAFLNAFFPASSGDVAKAYFGYKMQGSKERMVSVSIADKIIGLSSISFLGFPAALCFGRMEYILLSLAPLGLFAGFFILSVLNIDFIKKFKVYEKTRKYIDFHLLHKQLRVPALKIFISFALSIAAWMITFLQLALCFWAFEASVSLIHVYAIAPIYSLVRMFPLSLNGLGTDEAALLFLFKGFGVSATIIAAGLLYRVVMIFCPAIIGGAALVIFKKKYSRE